VFELADTVIRGDRAGVLKMINGLLADGNTPTSLTFFLGQHFLTLYTVKHGRALEQYRQWLTGKFRNQAARFETGRLEAIILDIAETDAALRHDHPDKGLLLEQLVLRLMVSPR
jgi:DNA polymerase III delta subunit